MLKKMSKHSAFTVKLNRTPKYFIGPGTDIIR